MFAPTSAVREQAAVIVGALTSFMWYTAYKRNTSGTIRYPVFFMLVISRHRAPGAGDAELCYKGH